MPKGHHYIDPALMTVGEAAKYLGVGRRRGLLYSADVLTFN